MNQDFLSELDGIRIDLARGAGMVSVIADGLSGFARCGIPSGAAVQVYVDAARGACRELSGIGERLQDSLERAAGQKEREAIA